MGGQTLLLTALAVMAIVTNGSAADLALKPTAVTVQENTASIIVNVTSTPAAATSFTITDTDSIFNIAPTGSVTLKPGQTLDYEKTSSYKISIHAAGPSSQTGTATLSVTVTDINEKPTYVKGSMSTSVCVNMTSGIIGNYTAVDPDQSRPNSTVKYSMTGDDPKAKFAYNNKTGSLTKTKEAFSATNSQYILVLTATDGGVSPLSGTLTLTVNVTTAACNKTTTEKSRNSVSALATSGSLIAVVVAIMIVLTGWV